MKKFIALLLFIAPHAMSAEVIKLSLANYDFFSHIRVSTQAQIIEAADASLIGKSSPFIQTLTYNASKKIVISGVYANSKEVEAYVQDQLCKESHEVALNPNRELGTKGTDSFNVKVNPNMIVVSGVIITDKEKPFSKSIICNQRIKNNY